MDTQKHRMRIGWFWSVVGGICAITIAFAFSSWIDNVHKEWMKCYEIREKMTTETKYLYCR